MIHLCKEVEEKLAPPREARGAPGRAEPHRVSKPPIRPPGRNRAAEEAVKVINHRGLGHEGISRVTAEMAPMNPFCY
jgi:hypothetical protein